MQTVTAGELKQNSMTLQDALRGDLLVTKRDKKSAKFVQNYFSELQAVMETLIDGRILDEKYLEHKLLGEHKDYLECHLKPNLLMIYKMEHHLVKFARLGTHNQLFKKF